MQRKLEIYLSATLEKMLPKIEQAYNQRNSEVVLGSENLGDSEINNQSELLKILAELVKEQIKNENSNTTAC